MLEKLIASLKQSLPGASQKKGAEDDDSHDEESGEHSDQDSGESHDTSDNDKKKKQISMIIRVCVVLGLAYLAIDQFVLKEDDPSTDIANIPVKPRKPRVKPVVAPPEAVAPATEAKPAEAVAQAEPVAEKAAEPVAPKEELPPVENINIAEKVEEKAPVEPMAVAPPEVKIEEVKTEVVKAEIPAEVPQELPAESPVPATGEVKTSESQIDKNIDSLIDTVDGAKKVDDVTGEKKESKLEDKIVADDVYTPPPQYDLIGRGLVYNCKEKYWACLDKGAYVACNKNMKWNKAHGKSAECVVQNVYNSDEDCGTIQKYNISTSQPTSFCK